MPDQPATPDERPDGIVARMHQLVRLDAPELRRADIAAIAGTDPDQTLRWWRAMGFPEVPDDVEAFGQVDVAMVRRLAALLGAGLLTDTDVLRLARLMGASFSRLAEAQVAVLDDLLAALPGADPSASRRDRLGELVRDGDDEILDILEQSMLYVWRRHLLAALGRWLSVDGGAVDRAVVFADLSGFTRLARTLTGEALAELVEGFEATAFDVVADHGGRVVKLIGDEVMFTAPTIDVAVDVALDLVRVLAGRPELPAVHCGVAHGPTVVVGGDVFGPTVNLASRLTEVARPDTVALPAESLAELAPRDDVVVRRIRRPFDLKGVGRVSVAAVRPRQSDDTEPSADRRPGA